MSFSQELKQELMQKNPESTGADQAELAAVLDAAGRFREEALEIRTENTEIEKRIRRLIRNADPEKGPLTEKRMLLSDEPHHHRKLLMVDPDRSWLLRTLQMEREGRFLNASAGCISGEQERRSFLRGFFLMNGSVGSPEKSYQMEFSCHSEKDRDLILGLLREFGAAAGSVKRRDRWSVYVKDGDALSDLLGYMGAAKSLMEYENIRIVKDIRNSVNREVNCDTANIAKAAASATRQTEDIRLIESRKGLSWLNESLQEAARVRLAYPELSLKDIGAKFDPPVGKSGARHRYDKLHQIAEQLKS